MECVLFPDAYRRLGARLRGSGPFVLEGVVARPPAPPVLSVEGVEDLGGRRLAREAWGAGGGVTGTP